VEPEFTLTGAMAVRPCVSPPPRLTACVEPPRDVPLGWLGWLADPPREGPDDPEFDDVDTAGTVAPARGAATVLGPAD
jgi:hypothetical protein